jgi:hypothetical protein
MGALLIDNEFMNYWLKLSSPEKESLLIVARHFVELKEANTSISSEQYNKEIDDTMNQMDNGEFISHQQVVERSEKWVNGR